MVSRLKWHRVIREGAELDNSNIEANKTGQAGLVPNLIPCDFDDRNIGIDGFRLSQYSGIRLTYCYVYKYFHT